MPDIAVRRESQIEDRQRALSLQLVQLSELFQFTQSASTAVIRHSDFGSALQFLQCTYKHNSGVWRFHHILSVFTLLPSLPQHATARSDTQGHQGKSSIAVSTTQYHNIIRWTYCVTVVGRVASGEMRASLPKEVARQATAENG